MNSVLNREGRPEPDVVAGFADRPVTVFAGMEGIPVGELWVLSKQRLQRFDGNFSEYKRVVSKRIAFSK